MNNIDPYQMELQMQSWIRKSTGIQCSGCSGLFFEPAFILRKRSRFETGNTSDEFLPVQAFRCMDCGELCKEMFPDGMDDVNEKLGLKKQGEKPNGKTIQM